MSQASCVPWLLAFAACRLLIIAGQMLFMKRVQSWRANSTRSLTVLERAAQRRREPKRRKPAASFIARLMLHHRVNRQAGKSWWRSVAVAWRFARK